MTKKKKIGRILLKILRKVFKKAPKKVVPPKKKVIKMKIAINKKTLQEEAKMKMTILKLSFIDLFFVLSEMDNVNKNKIRDYFYQYGIKETKENFIN